MLVLNRRLASRADSTNQISLPRECILYYNTAVVSLAITMRDQGCLKPRVGLKKRKKNVFFPFFFTIFFDVFFFDSNFSNVSVI